MSEIQKYQVQVFGASTDVPQLVGRRRPDLARGVRLPLFSGVGLYIDYAADSRGR